MRKILLLSAALVGICFYSTFSYCAEYWARTYYYGYYYFPTVCTIQQTSDEGCLLGASVGGNYNFNFIKLDKTGNVLWGKNFDSVTLASSPSLQQTSDGGYIIALSDMNTPSCPTVIFKFDSTGNIQWQKAYVGINSINIKQTSDGGYVVAGIGAYLNPDTASSTDFGILKLDKDGNIEWQKTYGGSNNELAHFIQQTKDGGYFVAGSFEYFQNDSFVRASWVLKLDKDGNIEWQKTYGFYPTFPHFAQTADGGYIIAGRIGNYDSVPYEVVILKLDKDGKILWQKAYGDYVSVLVDVSCVMQTSDGSYLLAGVSDSKSWLLKIAEGGYILWQRSFGDENNRLSPRIFLENKNGQLLMAGNSVDSILLLQLDKNGMIPGCEIIQTNNFYVSDIFIGWSNTSVYPYATSIVPTNTNIVPVDSSPVVNTICFQDSLNVYAGPDQTVFDTVTFDGSGSFAENGQIVSFTWELKHRENPSYNRTATGVSPVVTNLAKGFYDVTLTIEDDTGATGQDTLLLAASGSCESATTTTAPPTNIELSVLDAIPSDEKVILQWKTETEAGNAGFNVWRADNFVKVNNAVIPALGSAVSGSDYDFVDQWVLNGKRYFYLLEDIDTNGISTFHGPVKATPRWIYGAGK